MLLSAIALGIGTAAGIANAAYSHWKYKDQKKYNSAEAQKNRDWETEMSNTAYQRATADMEAAGLNPAMMYGGGSAASTPTASSASINANGETPFLIQGLQAASGMMSSAAQVMSASKPGTQSYANAAKIIASIAKFV